MSMLNAKPLASLSSGLLARKGTAKPAMRPQGFTNFAVSPSAALEDLGWNDLGAGEPAPTLVSPPPDPAAPVPVPPVLALREALAEIVEVVPEPPTEIVVEPQVVAPRPISLATAARITRDSAKQTRKGKAAFTLRLDAERHLRLRLASALSGRSAQLLVTDAVDALLRSMPQVDALVAQLPEPKRR